MDLRHTARVSEIISEHGWPLRSTDSAEIATAVWLLVQHADHDLLFQRPCLDLMTAAVDADEADRKLWAMLTDRVLLKEIGRQRYGTHWTQDPETGDYVPSPLSDPEAVERLRAT